MTCHSGCGRPPSAIPVEVAMFHFVGIVVVVDGQF